MGAAAVRGVLTTRQRSRRALSTLEAGSDGLIEHGRPTRTRASCGRGKLASLTALNGSARPGRGRLGVVAKGRMWQPHASTLGRVRRGSCSRRSGAPDPNDNQGLYNRMQQPNDDHLKLLFEYGLGKKRSRRRPWFKRFWQHWPYADAAPQPRQDIRRAHPVAHAGGWARNYFDRVKLLVENGVDVNHPDRGRTPYAEAVYGGHHQIADYLVAQGAKRIAITLSVEDGGISHSLLPRRRGSRP